MQSVGHLQFPFTDLSASLHGVSKVTHHHLGLILPLVGAGEPGEGLQKAQEEQQSFISPEEENYLFHASMVQWSLY